MERKKVRYICNPISGTGFDPFIENTIFLHTDRNEFDAEYLLTERVGHAFELAMEAVQANYYAVVAIGGDGTVHEIASALLGSQTALAIIPRGSGNGLALHLGLPTRVSEQVKLVYQGKPSPVDSVYFNEEPFFNMAGLGFEAEVAHNFANSQLRGWFSYLKNIINCWKGSKEFDVELKVKGHTIKDKFWQITIANGSQYGNNLKISPNSELDDAEFELLLMKKPGAFKVIHLVLKSFFNINLNKKLMQIYACSEAEINANTTFAHADGEPIVNFNGKLKLKINPKSILIIS